MTTMQAPPIVFAESNQDKVNRLIAEGGALLAALAALLQRGQITTAQFIERATAELRAAAHTAANVAGGGLAASSAVDTLIDGRSERMTGFAGAIAGGTLSAAQIAARANRWGGVLHTAYQMAKGYAAEQQATKGGATVSITWNCLDDKNSCEDCTRLAAGSPYTRETLPTHPGEDVQCDGNCRCDLEYEIVPAAEFARVIFYGPPLHFADGNCIEGMAYVFRGAER